MPNNNEFFKRNYAEEYYPDQMEERPSTEATWTIRLNQINIPIAKLRELSSKLWDNHNMELSRSTSNKDIVTVSGIRPDNMFGELEVMEVVRAYAPQAEVIPR